MITREDAERIREELLATLDEDAHNTQRLLRRLDEIGRERGMSAHAALLMILTRLAFDEDEARRHWDAILGHRAELARGLGRDAGLRVATLDYFMNVNRQLVQPTLIDLAMTAAAEDGDEVDRVTGLATARRFHRSLQSELRRARRYAQRAAVVLVDVDRFAEANQRFGPLVCDRLLRELALLLKNNIRDIDVAARPGEDEMALLLPETDRNGALMVAERFRREAEQYFARREGAGTPTELTVSAGVASFPEDASTPDELLQRAASALYEAKAAGRNTVRVWSPERRRYVRFDLEPGRFEIEVHGRDDTPPMSARNLSRNGVLFLSPERLEVGEEIEIRVVERGAVDEPSRDMRLRGRVVRLEELPYEAALTGGGERFEVGVALDLDSSAGTDDLLAFLERARQAAAGREP